MAGDDGLECLKKMNSPNRTAGPAVRRACRPTKTRGEEEKSSFFIYSPNVQNSLLHQKLVNNNRIIVYESCVQRFIAFANCLKKIVNYVKQIKQNRKK